MLDFLRQIAAFLFDLAHAIFVRSSHTNDIEEHPMNQPPAPLPSPTPPAVPTPREIVAAAAKEALGKDITPLDEVPDAVACVAQLVAVLKNTPYELPKTLTFTPYLFNVLRTDKEHWLATLNPAAGCIIISPSLSDENKGHCGIFLTGNRIASNNSTTGKWEDNYSIQSWVNYFKTQKGLHIYIFQPI